MSRAATLCKMSSSYDSALSFMAATGGAAAALAALLLLAVAGGPGPAGASWMRLYEGPGCSGKSRTFYYGCHGAALRGGYDFVYEDDESAFLFPHRRCRRRGGAPECPFFGGSTRNCTGVPFQSFYISKPPPISCQLRSP